LLESNIKLKSQILAKKGVLISDPNVRMMNSTQWTFEYLSHIEEQDRRYEEITALSEMISSAIINLLGLNIAPIEEEDPETGVKRLRPPEKHEFTPLAALLAPEEIRQGIIKKHDELALQQSVDAELEAEESIPTAEDIDASLGDIDFLEDTETLLKKAAWDSPQAKEMRELFIENAEDQPSIEELLQEPDSRDEKQMKEAAKLPKPKLVID
jgi:hypothetical protein